MMTLVRLHEVSKEWNGMELFAGLNLEINEGERLAILGRNGCGKTTLLRIILGKKREEDILSATSRRMSGDSCVNAL